MLLSFVVGCVFSLLPSICRPLLNLGFSDHEDQKNGEGTNYKGGYDELARDFQASRQCKDRDHQQLTHYDSYSAVADNKSTRLGLDVINDKRIDRDDIDYDGDKRAVKAK